MLVEYVDNWGTTEQERELKFACDRLMPEPDGVFFRGVGIEASRATVMRWLCQLKVAPYSYDWIDNLGRRSPVKLTPGTEHLELGQKFMFIFRLVDFDDEQLTLRTKSLFGELYVSYQILEEPTRLVVKLVMRYPWGPLGWLVHQVMRWGDFIMMRKQLLTLKRLAEGQEQSRAGT